MPEDTLISCRSFARCDLLKQDNTFHKEDQNAQSGDLHTTSCSSGVATGFDRNHEGLCPTYSHNNERPVDQECHYCYRMWSRKPSYLQEVDA